MAKITEKIADKFLGVVPDPVAAAENQLADIDRQITDQRHALTAAEGEARRFALDTLSGRNEADYGRAEAAMDDARKRLHVLSLARERMVEQLASLKANATRRAFARHLKSIEKLLLERTERAADIESAIGAFVRAWSALFEVTSRVQIACGPPTGMLTQPGQLARAVEQELYRLGGVGPLARGDQAPSIPGARCGDLSLIGTPEKLPSFATQITETNAAILRHLRGEAITNPPA